MGVSILGVVVGLAISIFMITRKLNPVASLFLGTVIGGLLGGLDLSEVVSVIISGSQSVAGINARIVAGGILAGVLIETGATETIATTLVRKFGEKRVLIAIALSAMITCASGIFITVSIVMLAPIALSVASKTNVSKLAALLAVTGGTKAGNLISPNPNAVAASEAFGIPLQQVMIAGFIPMVFGVILTVIFASRLKAKGSYVSAAEAVALEKEKDLPPIGKAVVAPIVAISLLMVGMVADLVGLHWIAELHLDVLFVLPIAAIIGAVVMGKGKHMITYANNGIMKMVPIILILIGAGALGQLITISALPTMIKDLISTVGIPPIFLAPISSAMMSSASASTATGVILAANSFASAILYFGVAPLVAAATLHAGAVVIDIMPHGNIFLASKESFGVDMKERVSIMPFEILIGGLMLVVSMVLFGIILY